MAKYFKDHEIRGLRPELVEMLDKAREAAGVPIVITSGFRNPGYNQMVGGVGDSSHIKGLAVDIRCPWNEYGLKIVYGLGVAGFKRIGIYDKHVHCDCDESKPQNVIWTGISH